MHIHLKSVFLFILCGIIVLISFKYEAKAVESSDPVAPNLENLDETSLDILLIGTAPGEGERGFAIILNKETKVQKICRVGDYISGAQIRQVYRDQVVLAVNGELELLTFADPRKVERISTEQAIDEDEIPKEVPNIVGYAPEVFVMREDGEPGPNGEKPPLKRIIIKSKQKVAP